MTSRLLIYACGVYSLAFAVFHMLFWRLFLWQSELRKLSLPNRGIMQILNTRLIYVFLLIAVLCFAFPAALTGTPLGRTLMAGFSLFWLGRTVEQFIFLKINHPMVHVLTFLFIIGTVLFALPLFV